MIRLHCSGVMQLKTCRYVCVVQKAYQDTDSVISSVTTKVKGFAFTNTSDMEPRFWDVADYVIPSQVFNHTNTHTHAHKLYHPSPF